MELKRAVHTPQGHSLHVYREHKLAGVVGSRSSDTLSGDTLDSLSVSDTNTLNEPTDDFGKS